MAKVVDITGQQFGRLTVLERSFPNGAGRNTRWKCRCACGAITIVYKCALTSGDTKSCGCLQKEINIKRSLKHGDAKRNNRIAKEYNIWRAMKDRCLNENNHAFHIYGGRGIKICDRWLNSYENFLEDMGRCPDGHSIDRIDNNGNYEPGNCRWATPKEQCCNTNRNIWIEAKGLKMILTDWARYFGIHPSNFYYWATKGLTPEETVMYFFQKSG